MTEMQMNGGSGQFAPSYVKRAELLAEFDGDADFVEDLVVTFLSRCPILVEDIRFGLRAGDGAATLRAAHTLKGSIAYFDVVGAYVTAEQIERTAAADLSQVPDLVLTLEQQLHELGQYLETEFVDVTPA